MDNDTKRGIAITTNIMLVVGFFIYYKFFDELKNFSRMLVDASPALIFVLGAVLIYSRDKFILKKRLIKNEIEKTFIITSSDIYFIYFLMILTGAGILFVSIYNYLEFDFIDIIQAIVGLMSIYFIKKRYFHFKFIRVSREEYAIDMAVIITYYDSMLMDALLFITPLIIVFIPGIIFRNLNSSDVIQSLISFLSIYWINKKYFEFD